MTPPEYCLIPLTKDKFAIVDADDYVMVSRFKWSAEQNTRSKDFYSVFKKGGRRVYMHRLILKTPDGMVTDHINHDTLDNRKINLRNATDSQNRKNRRKARNNKSGYKGASFNRRCSKWVANILIDGKYKHLGYFPTVIDAAKAYDAAAIAAYGAFACTNF